MAKQKDTGPELLGDILGRLFAVRGWGRRNDRLRLEQAWALAAGDSIAANTRLGNLRRGVLEVLVANAALMQELAGFHKRKFLEELHKQLPGVKILELRFKAGAKTV